MGKQCIPTLPESPASVNSDSSNHNTLLIHSLELEALVAAADIPGDDVSDFSLVKNVVKIADNYIVEEAGADSYDNPSR